MLILSLISQNDMLQLTLKGHSAVVLKILAASKSLGFLGRVRVF